MFILADALLSVFDITKVIYELQMSAVTRYLSYRCSDKILLKLALDISVTTVDKLKVASQ